MMIGADLARAAVLVPIAVAGLVGHLPLAALVVAAFLLETATSYFAPAYGALLPRSSTVRTSSRQTRSSKHDAGALRRRLGAGGGLIAVLPISTFFPVNAASFLVSAALLRACTRNAEGLGTWIRPRLREGFAALAPRPVLTVGIVVLGVGVTLSSGTWIGGVPSFVRDALRHGAGGFSLVMVGYAIGSIVSGALLARLAIRRKALVSQLAWVMYLPGYGLHGRRGVDRRRCSGARTAGVDRAWGPARAAQLRGAGGGAGLGHRPRPRAHLADTPRRTCDRAAPRRAAVRVLRAARGPAGAAITDRGRRAWPGRQRRSPLRVVRVPDTLFPDNVSRYRRLQVPVTSSPLRA